MTTSADPRRPIGPPAGAQAEHPVWEHGELPQFGWKWFRPARAQRMAPIGGPCTVVTAGGPIRLRKGWRGWLALDSRGYPYPIATPDHQRDYTPAGEQ